MLNTGYHGIGSRVSILGAARAYYTQFDNRETHAVAALKHPPGTAIGNQVPELARQCHSREPQTAEGMSLLGIPRSYADVFNLKSLRVLPLHWAK